jgi:hypothetical protein
MTVPERTAPACPICGGRRLRGSLRLADLLVLRCPACGHRLALHAPCSAGERDYHAQYDQGAFLDTLRATRLRQAERLLDAIGRHLSASGPNGGTGGGDLLDYGAGRGWFLAACRRRGIAPLAGADTSELAVAGLKGEGIEAHRIADEEDPGSELGRALSFRPRAMTLLDTLEHFPPDRLVSRLASLRGALGAELELLVVKVPVPGLLYRGARLASSLGIHGPIRQLYQMGTWPPHFHYFSPRSLERMLGELGFAVVERIGDLDFEPALLAPRMGVRGRALAPLVGLAAGAAAGLIRATDLYDTVFLLAKPAR